MSLYYWSLARLGLPNGDPIYQAIEDLLSGHFASFNMQQYSMLLYANSYILKRVPSVTLRESLHKFMDSKDKLEQLESLVHLRMITRCIHQVHKKSDRKGEEYQLVLEKIINLVGNYTVDLRE